MRTPRQYENHEQEWRDEENQRKYEQQQARKKVVTDPRDPDFIATETEDERED